MSAGDNAWGAAPNTPFWLVSRDKTIPLRPGSYVVGRSAEVEISFPTDPLMSRRHARLVVTQQGVEIEDLGSSNGTWVGSEMVQHLLRVPEGARVRVGQQDLELRRTHTARSRHNAATSPEIKVPRSFVPQDDAFLETTTHQGSPVDIVHKEASTALDEGRTPDALRLVDPLLDLLAKSEPRVAIQALEKASYLALRLAVASGRGALVDWAVLHHQLHAHVMTAECLDQFEIAAKAGVAFDQRKLDEYVQTLRRSSDDAAQLACARLAGVLSRRQST